MQLSQQTISSLALHSWVRLPNSGVSQLPEKVLQFGAGVLLRGLPDYYINEANNHEVFNGRIVVVKSTGQGSRDAFAEQDNLYTHCIKGIENGEVMESYLINAAISRVINANSNWQEVLECAHNNQLQIITSNTTEVGITLQEEDNIQAAPPQSFPGKLLAFLYERYKAFNGSEESGVVIIPTELVTDNAKKLKEIVLRLAQLNKLGELFMSWLVNANDWCNSLVDRIVPGALSEKDMQMFEQSFGYTDALAIMSEPYNLWAIEIQSERAKQKLSFSEVNKGVILTDNIEKYRELKLRLLNATHTFSCGLAFFSRFSVVNEAMQNGTFHRFISHLVYEEIIPCIISDDISNEEASAFAGNVLNRFSNPFIQHQWLAISLQYTGKMRSRCVPLINKYNSLSSSAQTSMALGFAAYLLFMKPVESQNNSYYGERKGERYLIQDDEAGFFYSLWQKDNIKEIVPEALVYLSLQDNKEDASSPFAIAVLSFLQQLMLGIPLDDVITLATRKATA